MTTTKFTRFFRAVGLGALLFSGSSQAAFIGDSVDCNSAGPSSFLSLTCNPATSLVSEGSNEFELSFLSSPLFDIDIDADSLTITSLSNDLELGVTADDDFWFSILDLDWLDNPSNQIIDFTLASSGVSGLSNSDISITSDSVRVNLGLSTWSDNSSATITLMSVIDQPDEGGVPEPSVIALFAAGLVGLGLARRRQNGRC